MDQRTKPRLQGFLEMCVPRLPRPVAEAMAVRPDFSFKDWMEVVEHCSQTSGERCYTMQVIALKRAMELASTLEDWICVAECLKGEYRRTAFEKIRAHRITTARDVELLLKSDCERLQFIGWYLNGRPDLLR